MGSGDASSSARLPEHWPVLLSVLQPDCASLGGCPRSRARGAHAVREVLCARTRPQPPETAPGLRAASRLLRAPLPRTPRSTWSSPCGRRWARATRARALGGSAARGPAASAPRTSPTAQPGLRARPQQGSAWLVRRGPPSPRPAARVPAAWPCAGSPPRSGKEEERLEELETDTAAARSHGWRQTAAAGGGTLPPPATGGGTPPRRPRRRVPSLPALRLRTGPGGTSRRVRWPCPLLAPPRPAGDPLQAAEEPPPPPPPPDRLRVPGKVEAGRGARGRPGGEVLSS